MHRVNDSFGSSVATVLSWEPSTSRILHNNTAEFGILRCCVFAVALMSVAMFESRLCFKIKAEFGGIFINNGKTKAMTTDTPNNNTTPTELQRDYYLLYYCRANIFLILPEVPTNKPYQQTNQHRNHDSQQRRIRDTGDQSSSRRDPMPFPTLQSGFFGKSPGRSVLFAAACCGRRRKGRRSYLFGTFSGSPIVVDQRIPAFFT